MESTEPVQPHDEYDTSAYLYIYAYTLKRAKVANKGSRRRERTTVTLRFRSFDRYEDNLREASRWRLAIKCLLNRLPVPKAYMSPAHRNLQSLLSGKPPARAGCFARALFWRRSRRSSGDLLILARGSGPSAAAFSRASR